MVACLPHQGFGDAVRLSAGIWEVTCIGPGGPAPSALPRPHVADMYAILRGIRSTKPHLHALAVAGGEGHKVAPRVSPTLQEVAAMHDNGRPIGAKGSIGVTALGD